MTAPIDLDELERLLAAATPGEWGVCVYDAGDREHYDHNGPCPSVQAESEDCAIVHWDGFKQKYWSSANGNQRQIEANATSIVALHNSAAAMIAEIRELRAENVRLRIKWAELHNTCNVVGSPYDEALQAVDRLVCHVRTFARAALTGEPQ